MLGVLTVASLKGVVGGPSSVVTSSSIYSDSTSLNVNGIYGMYSVSGALYLSLLTSLYILQGRSSGAFSLGVLFAFHGLRAFCGRSYKGILLGDFIVLLR